MTEIIDSAGDYRQDYFAQSSACISQLVKSYLKDATGLIYRYSALSYSSASSPPYNCLLTSRVDYQAERVCNDDASCSHNGARAIGTDFAYDGYGNLIRKTEHGDLSIFGDERTTRLAYNPNRSAYIVGLPAQQNIYSGEGTTSPYVKWTTFAYDGGPSNAPPTIGDLTQRVDGGLPSVAPISTRFSYDSSGNQTSVIDPNGNKATVQFDPTFNLYPIQTCNALGQCSQSQWDMALGKVTSTADPNGAATTNYYDVLGRLAQELHADGGAVQFSYTFTTNRSNQPTGLLTRSAVSDGSADGLWTDTYVDGMNRTYRIVTKGNSEQDLQYTDSTPNASAESVWFVPPNPPRWTRYQYDGARRLTVSTRADSSQQVRYAISSSSLVILPTAPASLRPLSRTMFSGI